MAFFDKQNRLEDKYKDDYSSWSGNPTKSTAGKLLATVQSEIDRGISAHIGQANPMITSRARGLALQAIKTYDPSKARLGTHIVNSLQGLKRISRKQTNILSIPERVSIDQANIANVHTNLSDTLGREPTLDEVADSSGLSKKRLAYIKKFSSGTASGTFLNTVGPEMEGFMPAVEQEDDGGNWIEFVYSDMDDVNKKIMEWTLGLHGSPTYSNIEISRRLRITPGAVSQRKQIIQSVLDQKQELDPFNG
jgi:DNA-directed RNA polymerase specialized sigma subunit